MKNKILLLIGIVIFVLGQVGINCLIYKDKNNLKLEEQKSTFAIMLEQNDGTYKKSASTSFNQPGYTFNSEKSRCIDMNGNTIDNALSYNATTKQMTVVTNTTAYCYVYFDK